MKVPAPAFLIPTVFLLCSCSVSGIRGRAPAEADSAEMPPRIFYEAAVRGTAVGLVKNPVTSIRKGVQTVTVRGREFLPVVEFPQDEGKPRPGSPVFEAALDREGLGTSTRGQLAGIFVDGDEFFPRLERAIAEADRSIDWRLFIFDSDDVAVSLAHRLRARSAEVPVQVLYDRFGSYMASRTHPKTPYPEGFEQPGSLKRLLRSGSHVEVRPQGNPWLVADHTKVLLFDRKTAFIGGMNIGREYRSEWHDLMVELEGPVVDVLAADFDRQWGLAGWFGDLTLLRGRGDPEPVARGRGTVPMRVLQTAPQRYEIERAHLAAIRAARDSIVIITPYFSSDFVQAALVEAASRGVRVDVILPAKNNSKIMGIANWDAARVLMAGGVRVHHYQGKSHLKAARCDSWVCLGSANLDTLSMRINLECNVAFSDPAAVGWMNRRVFEPDLRNSIRLRARDLVGKGSPLAETLADQL